MRATLLRRGKGLVATVALLLLGSSCGIAQDSVESSDVWDALSTSIAVSSRYTDNLFDYSPGDLLEFSDGNKPQRFSLNRPTDLANVVKLRVHASQEIVQGDPTTFRLRLNYNEHVYNPIRNYVTAAAEIRQSFFGSNVMYVRYHLLPRYYLRNLSYRDLSLTPRTWLKYAEARFSKQSYTVGVGRQLSSRMRASVEYSYEYTDYVTELNERDHRGHELDIDASARVLSWLRINTSYRLATTWSRGRELSDSLTDCSNHAHRFEVGTEVLFRRLVRIPLTLSFDCMIEYQSYLSDKRYDPLDRSLRYGDKLHYGRKDHTLRLSADMEYPLADFLDIMFSFEYERNRTNLTETGDAGNYQVHTLGVGFQLSF